MSQEHLLAKSFLLCRSQGCICALPLASVRETMRALPRSPVPDMPPFVLGVALIRGQVVPVLDLAFMLGSNNDTPGSRYVTLALGERQVALAVEDVIGVHALDTALLADVPPLLQRGDAALVGALGSLDAQLLLVLQATHLVPDSVWPALAARDGAA